VLRRLWRVSPELFPRILPEKALTSVASQLIDLLEVVAPGWLDETAHCRLGRIAI
jgi:hypothetical protein